MQNDDDILEDALNSGINFSSKKHNASIDYVLTLVSKFKYEIKDMCKCERDALIGVKSICMHCDGGRIKIHQ